MTGTNARAQLTSAFKAHKAKKAEEVAKTQAEINRLKGLIQEGEELSAWLREEADENDGQVARLKDQLSQLEPEAKPEAPAPKPEPAEAEAESPAPEGKATQEQVVANLAAREEKPTTPTPVVEDEPEPTPAAGAPKRVSAIKSLFGSRKEEK